MSLYFERRAFRMFLLGPNLKRSTIKAGFLMQSTNIILTPGKRSVGANASVKSLSQVFPKGNINIYMEELRISIEF